MLYNLTIEQVDDAIGVAGVMLRVRNHNDGGALLVKLEQKVHHLLAILGIQIARWLIGKDNLGIGNYCTGYSNTLLLTT